MATSLICSLIVFLALAPQVASKGNLRSSNATQALSGAVGDFEMDGSIQAGEAMDSEDAEAQDSYDKIVHQGLGEETGTGGSEKETQAAADAAESMADSTEPATEVIGDFDEDKVTDDPSTGATPAQSSAKEQNWESETPLEEKIGSQFDSFTQGKATKALIQSKHDDDDSEDADSGTHESSSEDSTPEEQEGDADAEGKEQAAPEEGSQSQEEAQEGSDIAMYAGGHLHADSPAEADTSGSEEGSDMALYASHSNSQSQSDQVSQGGQTERASDAGSGGSQSDHALYGGQEQDESEGAGDHSQSDHDANGGDEHSQSDMALYAGNDQEDSEAAAALIQTLRRHAALFGSGDEDDEEGEGLNEEGTDEDIDGESSDEADAENSQAADDAEEEEDSGAGKDGESEEAEAESEEMSDEGEEEEGNEEDEN